MSRFIWSIFFLFGCLGIFSCISRNNTGSGQKPGLIKVFSKGRDSLLFFIGPINYSSDSGEKLDIDYTWLKTSTAPQDVVCNFTVICDDPHWSPSSVKIVLDANRDTTISKLEKFFSESRGKKYAFRYSFHAYESWWLQWMRAKNVELIVDSYHFNSMRSWKKIGSTIQRQVIYDK